MTPRSLSSLESSCEEYPHTCMVCLDPLTEHDFESGEALQLQCACRGELALRHRACATQWAAIKGNNVCEVCGLEISNVVLPTDLMSTAAAAVAATSQQPWIGRRHRSAAKQQGVTSKQRSSKNKRRKQPLVKRAAAMALRFMCCIVHLPDDRPSSSSPPS